MVPGILKGRVAFRIHRSKPRYCGQTIVIEREIALGVFYNETLRHLDGDCGLALPR